MAQLYFKEVYRLHGLPLPIVSDHDTRFLSHFWRCLWRLSSTKLDFSSAYHPQIDGQTEVVNRSLGVLLRSLVGEHIKSRDTKLFQAKFAYNRSTNRSTGLSPFTIIYGSNPRFGTYPRHEANKHDSGIPDDPNIGGPQSDNLEIARVHSKV